jgi:hypothetical protein
MLSTHADHGTEANPSTYLFLYYDNVHILLSIDINLLFHFPQSNNMATTECCICCATAPDLYLDEKSGQPDSSMLQYPCCNRTVCPICLDKIPRFEEYCPYCQDTGTSSPRSDISWSESTLTFVSGTNSSKQSKDPEKVEEDAPDVLHFVDPMNDTIALLSIRYGVPPGVLRQTNGIYSDHLLAARKTILISGKYYKGGVSLNPRPVEGEEIDLKKSKIRRWMVACKIADYDVAVVYLEASEYRLDEAVDKFKQDEAWERAHPLKGKAPAKKKTGFWG